ncbi:structural protein [Bacillus chungangensis]|uniref:Minor capsid protein n=1 Tax=Bacillus chungangensis TaxID=587633 RepID=A0ABT9WMA5_9BACI|nr:phage minor capsid protein [Bacillus chungangensis]MDQ0174386.1 hypothetical protein [Bacillus chungangensis]
MTKREFRESPRPNYDYDAQRLVRQYEQALKAIRKELNSLFLTDFKRAQILAVEAEIIEILKKLGANAGKWASEAITKSARDGVASTLYSMGLAVTFEEAKKIATFNKLNKAMIEAIVADTQSDLLAVTENVERRTKTAIRRTSALVMRTKATQGINDIKSLNKDIARELKKRLGDEVDTAIIDAAGRRWRLSHYTEMLGRTKMMEAHLESTINEAIGRDVIYGVISRHNAKDDCRAYEGKLIKLTPEAPGNFPAFEDLPRNEIFHPCCKHTISPVRRPDRLPTDLLELNELPYEMA